MKEIDIGNTVICDVCNADYSESEEQGGLIYRTYAVCPRCAAQWQGKKEITRCTPGMSFRDWILKLRGGDNKIRIYP